MTKYEEVLHYHGFLGCGGGAMGFNRGRARVGNVEARFRCIGGFDVDPAACRDFKRNVGVEATCLDLFDRQQYIDFHGKQPPADWREATPEDIKRSAGNERPHIVFLSAPCLPADGLVLTSRGPRDISSMRSGDSVLTHRGRYRQVTHVGKHMYSGQLHGLRLNGTVDYQWYTDEHPLWIRPVVRRNATRRRELDRPRFVAAKEVRAGDRIGFPIQKEVADTFRRFIGAGYLAKWADTSELWWLLGCYLGDGHRRKSGRPTVYFSVGHDDGEFAKEVRESILNLGLDHHTDRSGGSTNVKIYVNDKHLHALCGEFGDGAECKRIPECLMTLEQRFVDTLIGGYRDADGSSQARRVMPRGNTLQARWKIPSVSLQLLRDIQRLLLRSGTFGSIHKCWPGGPQTIMGRRVQTLPRWELNVRLDPKKRTIFEFSDGAVWVRVREIKRKHTVEEVWNLSVEDDDTFCSPMIATHNCKGFSGLLSEKLSKSLKYQALNRLAVRAMFLMLEAWGDDPPELFIFENVPRIATRGKALLEQITELLHAYGYAVSPVNSNSYYDCGEIGQLAQSRKRFLMVARHAAKVPAFLYQPEKKPLRAVGEILGRMPLPGDLRAGPMHSIPRLQWKTWVRLAFVEAGSDWRSLNKLRVVDGKLADYLLVPEFYGDTLGVIGWNETAGAISGRGGPTNGKYSVQDVRQEVFSQGYGVTPWEKPATTIAGESFPSNGPFSVADVRYQGVDYGQYGVIDWGKPAGTVTSQRSPGQGGFAVADVRCPREYHHNVYKIVRWDEHRGAITSGDCPSNNGGGVADPRLPADREPFGKYAVTRWDSPAGTVIGGDDSGAYAVADPGAQGRFKGKGKYLVTSYDAPANTVIGGSTTGHGAYAVADPNIKRDHDRYKTAGLYGVNPWTEPCGAVQAQGSYDNGRWSVADPRLPLPAEKMVCVIRALDNTWHRPFTTLELAALQNLVNPGECWGEVPFDMDGTSDSAKRERIGNAVPPGAAEAIAGVMGEAILLSRLGERFQLSSKSIWVRPLAVALSVKTP